MKALLLILVLAVAVTAQAKLYIPPMENDFDGFLAAAIVNKKVPVIVTLDESVADYVLVGGAVKGDNKWSDTIFGAEKDRSIGSIRLIDPNTKTLLFAVSSGDRANFFAAWKSTGPKKIADNLAIKLKDYFKKNPEYARAKSKLSAGTNANNVPTAAKVAPSPEQVVPTESKVSTTAPESLSSIAVKSTPDGADIEVDGKYVGSTPSTVQLKVGDHKIAVKKKGYMTWERTLMLSAGGNIVVDASLEKEAPPIPMGGPPTLSTKPLKPAPAR